MVGPPSHTLNPYSSSSWMHLVEIKVNFALDTDISREYSTVLYLNSEGLCDLVGMVDCTELLTVWRPDLPILHCAYLSSEGF